MADEAQAQTGGEHALAPERALELIAAGASLIDVRSEQEWEAGRIAGARHVELGALSDEAGSFPRERPVIFYCLGDGRSQMAADAFRQAGWEAFRLAGGIREWARAGRELEPEDGSVRPPRLAS